MMMMTDMTIDTDVIIDIMMTDTEGMTDIMMIDIIADMIPDMIPDMIMTEIITDVITEDKIYKKIKGPPKLTVPYFYWNNLCCSNFR